MERIQAVGLAVQESTISCIYVSETTKILCLRLDDFIVVSFNYSFSLSFLLQRFLFCLVQTKCPNKRPHVSPKDFMQIEVFPFDPHLNR
ncbi:hypothetical protein EYZ11_007158 [Aspergillus tanneri]|uniref:Uncharacterized protein n=1 Tax=Aspergillus tanneri TaxID=1220188 RepID=A0A4S3JDN6_9EURO|nr:hypothetical protein EYZ11_007158 [Aspergillus tanneri]